MSTQHDLQIVSYMVASELFDQGKTLYDCFTPLIETIMQQNNSKTLVTFNEIERRLRNTFFLSVPKATLKRLLDSMQQHGIIVKRSATQYSLSDNQENSQEKTSLITEIEDFFDEFKRYLSQSNPDITIEELKQGCCRWVYLHSIEISSFIGNGKLNFPSSIGKNKNLNKEWEYSDELVDFLIKIRDDKRTLFLAFIKIYNGAVQASLLNYSPQQIGAIDSHESVFSKIILDTNFLFRLLNLQTEYDLSSATETISNIKNSKVTFYILDKTLEEMQRSIKAFLKELEPYTVHTGCILRNRTIRVSGFLSALQRGITRSQFFELTDVDILKVKISSIVGEVNFVSNQNIYISNEEIESLISYKKKDGYGREQAEHDLSLIHYCISLRGSKNLSFKNTTCWILTNDERLAYWNSVNSPGCQECITEIQLSNLYWLQKKRSINEGLMQTIMSLANGNALTIHGATKFASKIDTYIQTHNAEDKAMETIALLLGGETLSANDIKELNEEEFLLDDLVAKAIEDSDKKNKAIEEERQAHIEQAKLLNEYSEKAGISERQIDLLKQKINLGYELQQLGDQKQHENALLKQLNDIRVYRDRHKKIACRIVSLLTILTLALFVVVAYKWVIPLVNINGLLQKYFTIDANTRGILELLCGILLPVVAGLILYLFSGVLFGHIYTPKEMFGTIESKILEIMVNTYMNKNGIDKRACDNTLDKDIASAKAELFNLEEEIEQLKRRLEQIDNDLAA